MKPSFDDAFVESRDYEDLFLRELRRGKVMETWERPDDYSLTEITTSWNEQDGFREEFKTLVGDQWHSVHDPSADRTETHVSEALIRARIRAGVGAPSPRRILADAIRAEITVAQPVAEKLSAAQRLVGRTSPELPVSLDVFAEAVAAARHDEARTLFESVLRETALGLWSVYRLGEDEPARLERWLAAARVVFPHRGDVAYWHSAALELCGRRKEALTAYTQSRGMGKVRDYFPPGRHWSAGPATLRALLQRWQAKKAARDR